MPSSNMYINQQGAQILVINLCFPLDALHVSDYISPSLGATLYIHIYIYTEEKRGTTFRSSTDEIFETLTGNNKIR